MTDVKAPLPVLSRSAIQGREDLTTDRVEVPEWGGVVLVKVLKADEKNAWEKSCTVKRRLPAGGVSIEPRDNINARVSLAITCCVTEDGQPLFTADDAGWLGTKSAAAIERVFEACCRVNRIGKTDVAELTAEDEEKNS